jgi:membrane associated rhomboid family serine protease
MVLLQFVLGTRGIDLADYLGLHYFESHYFRSWQLLTHLFMHGSYNDLNGTFWHIFSNMFALWMFGSVLENVWGPKRFIIFYLVCGLGAALCHLGVLHFEYSSIEKAFHSYQENPNVANFDLFLKQHVPNDNQFAGRLWSFDQQWLQMPEATNGPSDSKLLISEYLYGGPLNKGIFDEPTVGASGAVFGVLFAFGYLFPNTLLYLYFLVPIKAKWIVAAYALFELYSGIRNSAGDNIAHFAHLGGMLFAFILLKIWGKTQRNQFY